MANFSQKCHKKLEENGEKWGKMGNLFYGESGKQIGKFPLFPHFSPLVPPRHHVRTVQWGAMLELHSAVRRHARTAQWGAMLELHSEVGCHVRTAQWGVILELHCWHHVRNVQWGAMLELHNGAAC